MGDGVVRKVAIVFNADIKDEKHIDNARDAVRLFKQHDYEVALLNPKKIKGISVDHYASATKESLDLIVNGTIEGGEATGGLKTDDDDLVVIYFTGHGNGKSNNEIQTQNGSVPHKELFEILNHERSIT